jgi:hypothetical protein
MTRMPDPNSIDDDSLLLLGIAAALELLDGSIGASGLRREAQNSRLPVARKDYTTPRALRGNCVLSSTKT